VGLHLLCMECTVFYLTIQELLEQASCASFIMANVAQLATCPPSAQMVVMISSLQKAHWILPSVPCILSLYVQWTNKSTLERERVYYTPVKDTNKC
jgi:hypothetical protein